MPLHLSAREAAGLTGAPRRPKYGNRKTVVDGITFDSAKEAKRYRELRLLEKAGDVWDLELQPEFVLFAPWLNGTFDPAARKPLGVYRGDFKYHDRTCDRSSHLWIVEDVKGYDTPLSRWKRKHVAAQYGIDVRII